MLFDIYDVYMRLCIDSPRVNINTFEVRRDYKHYNPVTEKLLNDIRDAKINLAHI